MYFCILNTNYAKADNAHRYCEVEICNEYTTRFIIVQMQIQYQNYEHLAEQL